jgi:flagellar motor switch protein FliN/FliY
MSPDADHYKPIQGVTVTLHARLGRARLKFRDVESLRPGSVVTLDRLAGEPVEILCHEQIIAYGEVMIQDEAFTVRLTRIVDRSHLEDDGGTRVQRGRK